MKTAGNFPWPPSTALSGYRRAPLPVLDLARELRAVARAGVPPETRAAAVMLPAPVSATGTPLESREFRLGSIKNFLRQASMNEHVRDRSQCLFVCPGVRHLSDCRRGDVCDACIARTIMKLRKLRFLRSGRPARGGPQYCCPGQDYLPTVGKFLSADNSPYRPTYRGLRIEYVLDRKPRPRRAVSRATGRRPTSFHPSTGGLKFSRKVRVKGEGALF